MVGPWNDSASVVTTLFVRRLVTVHVPTSSSVAFRQSDHPTGRILKVKSAIGEPIELFPDSHGGEDVLLGLHPYL